MKRRARAFAVAAALGLLLFASGCAVMSTSVMETAETVEPGHLKLGAEYNVGLELTSLIFLEDDTSGTFVATELAAGEAWGAKLGCGLVDGMDLTAKLWVSVGGVGGKLYVKKRLTEEGSRFSMAVAPGIAFVSSESDDENEGSLEDYIAEVRSVGAEVPFIVTYRLCDVVAVSGIARYSLDSIALVFHDESLEDLNDTWLLHRFGLINGWSFDLGPVYLRPEIGVEMAAQINGSFGYVPIFALGAGFEF
ncbi:hypothetical protein K8S17_03385 [bacterium]|nr:hypothetical protein [bacterium]